MRMALLAEGARRRKNKSSKCLHIGPVFTTLPIQHQAAAMSVDLLWLQLTKDERKRIANRQFERKQGTFCLRRERDENKAKYNLAVGYNLGSSFRIMELQMDPSSG